MQENAKHDSEQSPSQSEHFFSNPKPLKIIIALTIVGGCLGILVASFLPAKFSAFGSIRSAQVNGKAIESAQELANKMQSPSYYSETTMKICGVWDRVDPATALARALNPHVPRRTEQVNVRIEMPASKAAASCLDSVLLDVRSNQKALESAMLDRLRREIELVRAQLKGAKFIREQEISLNQKSLIASMQQLKQMTELISDLQKKSQDIDLSNAQIASSSLVLQTLQAKQTELSNLQIAIEELRFKTITNTTSVDGDIFRLEDRLTTLSENIKPPLSQPATFNTPVYAPPTKTSPKLTVVALTTAGIGFSLGLLFSLFYQHRKHSRRLTRSTSLEA